LRGPCQDELPRLLPDLAELDERGVGEPVAGFLRELSAGDRDQLLSLLDLAFGDRPVTQVLVHPGRTTLVREQHLQAMVPAAPEQDAGAGSSGLVGRHRHLLGHLASHGRGAYGPMVRVPPGEAFIESLRQQVHLH
jgi:hypothetical protein